MLPRTICLLTLLAYGFYSPNLQATDWPMWRYDPQRSAASPQILEAKLHLQWVREYPKLQVAWSDQAMMPFDAGYEPVVSGHTMYVGSSQTDSITAIDTRTGLEIWRFFTDGPVRFAPTIWDGKVYFVSDDGYLYCIDAGQGKLIWKLRGGPDDRKILGNERLISMWPARGAPVIEEGTVYFAAGIWPFMGIFIHAVDAKTGKIIWTNDGDGSLYIKQPHNADSFAGVAPQGPFTVLGDRLLIPGGRSVPAVYDRTTGKLLHYLLAENSKKGGGSLVAVNERYFINGNTGFDLKSGKYEGVIGQYPVMAPEAIYTFLANEVGAWDWKQAKSSKLKWFIPEIGSYPIRDVSAMIKAGNRLYVGTKNQIIALDLPLPTEQSEPTTPVWKTSIAGTPFSMIAADDRLFVTTLEGRIYCFGKEQSEPVLHSLKSTKLNSIASKSDAEMILKESGIREGYAVIRGIGSGELIRDLIQQSDLRIVVVDPNKDRVESFRKELVGENLHGQRVAVIPAEVNLIQLPLYFASLMVVEDLSALGTDQTDLPKLFHSLRPYGGTLWLNLASDRLGPIKSKLEKAVVKTASKGCFLIREGALPGSANWTHEHGDATNCRVSKDQLVKAPLGLLWFGGPSHEGILPRHGHGPQPQVVEGRLVIEGVDKMRSIDIYTGRLLWETSLPGVGAFFDNLAHQPGANASSANYISMTDGIYIAYEDRCVVLDPATGKKFKEYQLPVEKGQSTPPRWGYINVAGDYLIGGADPIWDPKRVPPPSKSGTSIKFPRLGENDNMSSSRSLVVMNRQDGKVLWETNARHGFRHNAICIGNGKLFAVDRLSSAQLLRLKKEGKVPTTSARIVAFDLKTGKELWSADEDIFGTWLSYSEKYDVLVESGRVARDTLTDEPKGMRAYRASNGVVMWEEKTYVGPAMLHGDTIFKDRSACSLLTGESKVRPDPITGLPIDWTFTRNYGCNTPLAAEHLLTFRSGAAGYCDLLGDSGTGNFGGFRSSCTNNLIVAGGIITAPDYTRTCTCSYQNQCSLALVPMADAEMWTSYGKLDVQGIVKRVGINFGAPGDRKGAEGTLWLEYPSVGGLSPNIDVHVTGKKLEYFRRHSSQIDGILPWVSGSGVKGVETIGITLGLKGSKSRSYSVRLYFAEVEDIKSGDRLFDLSIQGEKVLTNWDIAKEVGTHRTTLKEFKNIQVDHELVITFTPSTNAKIKQPIVSGIEIRLEEK